MPVVGRVRTSARVASSRSGAILWPTAPDRRLCVDGAGARPVSRQGSRAIAINVWSAAGASMRPTDDTHLDRGHIKKFLSARSGPTNGQFSLLLALWTGQRQGDLIRLTWMQYDGSKIRLKQGKGKKRVVIPGGAPLKPRSTPPPRNPIEGVILRNTFGEQWTSDGFGHRGTRRLSEPGSATKTCTSTTLRGTAVTRLALSGCTVPRSPSRPLTARRGGDPLKRTTSAVASSGEQAMMSWVGGRETERKLQTELPNRPHRSDFVTGLAIDLIVVGAQGLEPGPAD